VVGIFPNDASMTRLVGAMMLEQNDEWSLNRRYMQLEGLFTIRSSPSVPGRSTQKALTIMPRSSSGTPITPHSATAGWRSKASSTSGPRRCSRP
jgi:hypothetical protein